MTSELEEHLAALDEIERPEHFQIDDDGAAAWAMRKLRRLRQQQASNVALAEEQIQKISDWLSKANRSSEDSMVYFENILSDYAIRQRLDHDRKTIDLPEGKISTRTGTKKFSVDPGAFLPWARENAPDLIRVKEEPSMTEMKARLQIDDDGEVFEPTTGEFVPGVMAVETGISVSISPDLEV